MTSARYRNPLRLSTGQLGRKFAGMVGEPKLSQCLIRTNECVPAPHACKQQRNGHVVASRQVREQLAELEHEAELGQPQPGPRGLTEIVDASAVQLYLPLVRTDHPGQHMQQC